MQDKADLSRLNDIVIPRPVSWWPPAPGWWIISTALLAVILIIAVFGMLRWLHNAYRREALAELDRLVSANVPAPVATISTILKRTAFVAFPRTQVAYLTGDGWLAFLSRNNESQAFKNQIFKQEIQTASGSAGGNNEVMLSFARDWVKHHRRAR